MRATEIRNVLSIFSACLSIQGIFITSKIVVFPEPVGPVIRKDSLELKSSKSIEVLFVYAN